jgi:DNA-binding NarL/FixJ family response regulator
MRAIRALLVDDHAIMRAALRCWFSDLPDIEVVGEAADGREAIEQVALLQPDLVIMDITMPNLSGIEATRIIRQQHPQVRVLILSMHMTEDYVVPALRAGATGYVHKGSPPRELELAIEAVASGQLFLSQGLSRPAVGAFLSQTGEEASGLEQLTSRQREILQLIAEGHSSKQIAQILDSSVKTVEAHRANIMERLDIHNLPGLVRYAIRCGLISLEG